MTAPVASTVKIFSESEEVSVFAMQSAKFMVAKSAKLPGTPENVESSF